MTILVSEIITRAQDILNDVAVRWTSAELVRYINDAMREIAVAHPESAAVVANISLVAGTKQALPAAGIALVKLTRNMGASGTAPGAAPRPTTQALMDAHRPTWHTDTATLVVKHYMKDPLTPRVFYVHPPMSGTTMVEGEYSAFPAPVASMSDPITLPDFYLNPILDYTLWRAFQKDIEIPAIAERSALHRKSFENTLGLAAAKGAA